MKRYLVQRILSSIPVMLIVAVLTFSLIHLAPGDPAALMAGIEAQEEEIEEIRERLGLNRPLPIQLGIWFKDLFQGDLGTSLHSKFPIRTLIKQRLPATLSVGVFAQVVAIAVGVVVKPVS